MQTGKEEQDFHSFYYFGLSRNDRSEVKFCHNSNITGDNKEKMVKSKQA